MHRQDASCCQTLTEGPAVIGKRKGSAISALQIHGEISLLEVSSALACVAKELIQGILPVADRPERAPLQRTGWRNVLSVDVGCLATPGSV